MHNLALLIVSGFCALLLLVPLPLHIRTRNTGALLLLGWLLCGDIVVFVNSILFWNSIDNVAPVWCDISKSALLLLTQQAEMSVRFKIQLDRLSSGSR